MTQALTAPPAPAPAPVPQPTAKPWYCCQPGVESPFACYCPDEHSCDCVACQCN